jgi:cell division septum initiation protein DivIVA
MQVINGLDGLSEQLELVRRGYDPEQVHRVMTTLSTELKTVAADNEILRAQIDELNAAPPSPTIDVFAEWSRETNELLEAARHNVERVMAKANADAAALTDTANADAATIRAAAQADADRVLQAARAEAAEVNAEILVVRSDAHAEAKQIVQIAHADAADINTEAARNATKSFERSQQQGAEIIAAAENRAAEIDREADATRATIAASVGQARSEVESMHRQVIDLEAQRQAIRARLIDVQSELRNLLNTVTEVAAAAE